jgi:hypothetical protein
VREELVEHGEAFRWEVFADFEVAFGEEELGVGAHFVEVAGGVGDAHEVGERAVGGAVGVDGLGGGGSGAGGVEVAGVEGAGVEGGVGEDEVDEFVGGVDDVAGDEVGVALVGVVQPGVAAGAQRVQDLISPENFGPVDCCVPMPLAGVASSR